MKTIFLSCGTVTKVSDEDHIYLLGYTWALNVGGYARSWVDGKMQLMHRVIAERAGIDCSDQIDHKNCDPLDNRRENLRPATNSQNRANSKVAKGSVSGLKGAKERKNGRWNSLINVNGVKIHLGDFDTKEEAHGAYCDAARHYFKEFANSGAKYNENN